MEASLIRVAALVASLTVMRLLTTTRSGERRVAG